MNPQVLVWCLETFINTCGGNLQDVNSYISVVLDLTLLDHTGPVYQMKLLFEQMVSIDL